MQNKLYRSKTNKLLTGFCGGVAEFFNIPAWVIRLIVFLIGCSFVGIVAYFVASYFIPEKPDRDIKAEYSEPEND